MDLRRTAFVMPNFKLLKKIEILLVLLFLGAIVFFATPKSSPKKVQDVFFRVNQLSYAVNQPFDVVVLTKMTPSSLEALLLDRDLKKVTDLKWSHEGIFNQYFKYKINVPALPAGAYRFKFQGETSQEVLVSATGVQKLVESTLEFFRFQRCGYHKGADHQLCHQSNQDVTGGWHDAGDYIRFVLTTSYATTLILNSAQFLKNPQLVNKALEEAEWGLLWLDKMWSQKDNLLYQVGDASDHDKWRLPWSDDAERGPMRTYALKNNEGANLAGRIIASFALYASLTQDPHKAAYWKKRAEEIYLWSKEMMQSSSSTDNFYQETQWQDDMALAVLELYHLTQQKKYLDDARVYLKKAKNPYTFDYANLHILGFFKLGFYNHDFSEYAKEQMRNIIAASVEDSKKSFWGVAAEKYFWGSHMHIFGMAIGAILLDHLENKNQFKSFSLAQWNYLLGANQWGVSFVGPIGNSPKSPHHQIADLDKKNLPAFWVPGPIPKSQWLAEKIVLARKDLYLEYQSEDAVYHDDKNDYITNEPTLTMSATGLFLSVLMEL